MTEIDWSKHKYCPSCKTVHPLTHFYKNRNASSNYMKHCKTCVNARKKRTSDKPYKPRQPASDKTLNTGNQDTSRLEYRLNAQTGMKKCKNCRGTFLASNFYREPRTADRLASNCKPCHKEKYHVKYVPRPKKPKPDPINYESTNLKECKECGETFPHTEFFKEARNKDGLNARCKTCFNKRYYQKDTMKKQTYDPSSPVKTCNTCGETKDKSEFYSAPSNADGLMHRCKPCHKEHLNSKKVTKAQDQTDGSIFSIKTTGAKSYRGWVYLLTEKTHPEHIYLYPSKQDTSALLANLNVLTPDGDGWNVIASRESNSTENLFNTLFHYLSQEFSNYVGFGFAIPSTHLSKSRFIEAFNYYADCYTATVGKIPLPTRVTPSSEGSENPPPQRVEGNSMDSIP